MAAHIARLAVATAMLTACTEAAMAADELRGVYMELHSNRKFGTLPLVKGDDWRALMRQLKSHGVNAVFPCSVSASGACYPSKVVAPWPAERMQGHTDLLATIIDAAHAEGLQVHPWTIQWYKAPRGTPKNRLVQTTGGKTHNSLCPSIEANRDLMRRMILEIVTGYDIDGVQYDYMRFPSREYCYCASCRAGFERTLGRAVADWPAGVVKGGALEKRYADRLAGLLDSFVKEMYPLIKKAKPKIVISCAVWPSDKEPRNAGVRQNWGRWATEGWVDLVAPMNYGNKWIVDRFAKFAGNEAKQLKGKKPFVYGLGAYQDTPEGVVKAVKAGRELGGSGFIVYTLTEDTMRRHLPALGRGPWRTPARVPAFLKR